MKDKKNIICFTFVILILFCSWIIWENKALMINEIIIENEKIPDSFSGFRIAQVSDLHNTEFGKDNEKLLALLDSYEPNIILITGDLIDSRRTNVEIAISFSEKAVEIAPTYYVTGNHESRIDEYKALEEELENAGVQVLKNERVLLNKSEESICIAGMEDPSFVTDYLFGDSETVTKDVLSKLITNEEIFTILLSHRPELFDIYVECKADLVFSGHAHGGQFRLPFIGGIVAPNQGWLPEYDSGLYTKGNTDMIVSRGVGNSLFPFRINNRPEIVLVELKSNPGKRNSA